MENGQNDVICHIPMIKLPGGSLIFDETSNTPRKILVLRKMSFNWSNMTQNSRNRVTWLSRCEPLHCIECRITKIEKNL